MKASIISAMRPSFVQAMRPTSVAAIRASYINNLRASLVSNLQASNVVRSTPQTKAEPVTHKLKKLKNVPAELYPLFITLLIGLGAAGVAVSRKFLYDPSVRVNRSSK
ncbi:uncharacterized protein V1513DRAFT_439675 [Lipomyces chichibuensis]|uniref:uncharacterized protein n=1 Tax=Lipomyces chichibuensis TaxID=1546026 RepID=UPI0033433BDF